MQRFLIFVAVGALIACGDVEERSRTNVIVGTEESEPNRIPPFSVFRVTLEVGDLKLPIRLKGIEDSTSLQIASSDWAGVLELTEAGRSWHSGKTILDAGADRCGYRIQIEVDRWFFTFPPYFQVLGDNGYVFVEGSVHRSDGSGRIESEPFAGNISILLNEGAMLIPPRPGPLLFPFGPVEVAANEPLLSLDNVRLLANGEEIPMRVIPSTGRLPSDRVLIEPLRPLPTFANIRLDGNAVSVFGTEQSSAFLGMSDVTEYSTAVDGFEGGPWLAGWHLEGQIWPSRSNDSLTALEGNVFVLAADEELWQMAHRFEIPDIEEPRMHLLLRHAGTPWGSPRTVMIRVVDEEGNQLAVQEQTVDADETDGFDLTTVRIGLEAARGRTAYIHIKPVLPSLQNSFCVPEGSYLQIDGFRIEA